MAGQPLSTLESAIDMSGQGNKMNSVQRAYRVLRERAVHFDLKPGEHLNEVELANELDMSRAPLREALNRLVTDGLLTVVPNKGFSCRKLSASEITSLYGVRADLETGGLRDMVLASCQAGLEALARYSEEITAKAGGLPIETLVARDEEFHLKLAGLAGNVERVRLLEHINARIHFVRRVNLEIEARRRTTFTEHEEIVNRLLEGNTTEALNVLRRHLAMSAEEAMSTIHKGLARIYGGSVE
jgi:DNA-binding GntR family transcriptional regulator